MSQPYTNTKQTSHAFFEAEKSYVETTIALDASCNANFAKCNTLTQNIAYKIKQPEVCGADYTAQNPLVLQAYQGLLAYASMYQAGCLKDTAGSYCKQSSNQSKTDNPTDLIRFCECHYRHKFLPCRCLSVLASSRNRYAFWCSRNLYHLHEEHDGYLQGIRRQLHASHQQDLRRSSSTHQYRVWTGLR